MLKAVNVLQFLLSKPTIEKNVYFFCLNFLYILTAIWCQLMQATIESHIYQENILKFFILNS